jgi:dTDP-4-dehydrorhamnose 3,5-epimerase
MKFLPTKIPDVVIVEPRVFGDFRGSFMETWEYRKFAAGGIEANFVQDNHSVSSRGVLRGLHYQLCSPQGKLVRVASGEVFDVAVDLRRSSSTFGQWVGEILSATNRRMLWIPPGFAHGFLTLSERADFIYKCTNYYDPASERALLWSDSIIGIEWPVLAGVATPIVSAKDAEAARFAPGGEYFP